MKLPTTSQVLEELSRVSVILAVGSALPYTMGDAANVLGPTAKKWVAIIGVTAAGLAKTADLTIKLVAAMNKPSEPPASPTGATPAPPFNQPISNTPPVAGPFNPSKP